MMDAHKISSPLALLRDIGYVLCSVGTCAGHSCSSCSYNTPKQLNEVMLGERELNAPVREFNVHIANVIQQKLCVQSTCESRCEMCLYSNQNIKEFMGRIGNDCT